MLTFLTAALLSALAWTMIPFIDKFSLEHKLRDPVLYVLITNIVEGMVFLLIAPLFFRVSFPSPDAIPYVALVSVFYFAAYLFYIKGLSFGDFSSVSSLVQMHILFIVILSGVFLGEFYGILVALWMAVIFCGAVMSTWKKGISLRGLLGRENKVLIFILLHSLCLAIAGIISRFALNYVTNIELTVWAAVFYAVLTLFVFPFFVKIRDGKKVLRVLPFILLATFFVFVGYVTMFYAFTFSVSITTVIGALQGVFGIMIAFFLSKINPNIVKESHDTKTYSIRLAGAALILTGIYFITTIVSL